MQTSNRYLTARKASDIMSRKLVTIDQAMSIWEAADVLAENHVSGAPVVDEKGRCVGFLSAAKTLHALRNGRGDSADARSMQATCSFQKPGKTQTGEKVVVCTLPPGACPIQKKEEGARLQEVTVCTEPYGVLADWQTVESGGVGGKETWRYMTVGPEMASPDTPVEMLARRMVDAHVDHVFVVDDEQRPIGVVSSADVLAIVALAGERQPEAILEK